MSDVVVGNINNSHKKSTAVLIIAMVLATVTITGAAIKMTQKRAVTQPTTVPISSPGTTEATRSNHINDIKRPNQSKPKPVINEGS